MTNSEEDVTIEAEEALRKTFVYLNLIKERVMFIEDSKISLTKTDIVALGMALMLTFDALCSSSECQEYPEFRSFVAQGVKLYKNLRTKFPE